ncbi:hypothetical protein HMSSN139_06030 [Paenibacillus sp. HMSSN-139]|nr:hypothetical protein HMSSN139_06030 [Paenibacillus sp. HMSSN-139]
MLSFKPIGFWGRFRGGTALLGRLKSIFDLRFFVVYIIKHGQMENLYEAWLEVKKNKGSGGIDGLTIERFEKNLGTNLREIQRLLQQDRYEPDPVLR